MRNPDARHDDEYERLRWAYKPDTVRYLLVGESPPDPRGGPLRFFYSPQFRHPDNLYVSVVTAILGSTSYLKDKSKNLSELQRQGWWLVDAVGFPINGIKNETLRRAAIREGFRSLQVTLRRSDVRPAVGAIICMPRVFQELANPIRKLGVRVLHECPISFPIGEQRDAFIQILRGIVRLAGRPAEP